MTDNEEKKGPIEEATKSTLTDTKWETTNQLMRQNMVEFVSIQQSPPRRLSGSSQRSPPSSARGSPNSSPRLRSSKKKKTPRTRRSPINRNLLVVHSNKRKHMDGFSRHERLEEHVDQNLELVLELATLKEKRKKQK